MTSLRFSQPGSRLFVTKHAISAVEIFETVGAGYVGETLPLDNCFVDPRLTPWAALFTPAGWKSPSFICLGSDYGVLGGGKIPANRINFSAILAVTMVSGDVGIRGMAAFAAYMPAVHMSDHGVKLKA